MELQNGFMYKKEWENVQKEMRKAAVTDVQQTGLNESRRQKKDDKGRKIVPNIWWNINVASTLKLMTSLNSKHLDMRSSNLSHNLLSYSDVFLCSQGESFFVPALDVFQRFLVFKSVLFEAFVSELIDIQL